MKILHYSLGFPPYRTGGLTKYCMDLMEMQIQQGHDVALLWPGMMEIISRKIKIKNRKNYKGINSFEIVNPLPVSLLDGINDIKSYTLKCDKEIYKEFLTRCNPEIIHIHTFMGLHKEFLEITNELKIKTIFTTHDYFGICPKVNLLKSNKPCINDNNCEDCIKCNSNALTINKIKILQSPIYRVLKNSKFVKKLRKKHKENFENIENSFNDKTTTLTDKEYRDLRKYYMDMLSLINKIHFNSNLSKEIYSKYINVENGNVISITHKDIKDNRKIKKFEDKLKITYLGPTKAYKGFYMLIKVLNKIYNENSKSFELNIYYPTNQSEEYLNKHDMYTYNQLENILDNTDLLIAPSIWYETFGFTVLEALSYGVPVLVTTHVGAKDIVGNFGFIINPNEKELEENLIKIINDREELYKKNDLIVKDFNIEKFELKNHAIELYKDLLGI